MKKILTILALLAVVSIFSCSKKQENQVSSKGLSEQGSPGTDQSTPEQVEISIDRKIVKEGEIIFKTTSVSETKSSIIKTVQKLNGYISKDNVIDYSNKLEHHLIIRVPADKFDILVKEITEYADKLDSKNVAVLDVTEEFIDIEARIKTKKELENRYKELLKQATRVDEILSIEREIGQLRMDIESVEGRMKYLKDKITFSTLTVTYYQKTNTSFRFFYKLGEALKAGWDGFLWFLIGLTHLWTFILIGFVTVYIIVRVSRKKRKNIS